MASDSPSLIIAGAAYGGVESRAKVYDACLFEKLRPVALWFDTKTLDSWLGDPMPKWMKSLSILYTYYPDQPRIYVAEETVNSVQVNFTRENLENSYPLPNIQGQCDKGVLLALVYGRTLISDQSIYSNMITAFNANKPFQVTNQSMGQDPWKGSKKSATLYYETKDGNVHSASCGEGESLIIYARN